MKEQIIARLKEIRTVCTGRDIVGCSQCPERKPCDSFAGCNPVNKWTDDEIKEYANRICESFIALGIEV